jgi:hypothetical protein
MPRRLFVLARDLAYTLGPLAIFFFVAGRRWVA